MLWIGETDYQETMQDVKTPLDITGYFAQFPYNIMVETSRKKTVTWVVLEFQLSGKTK